MVTELQTTKNKFTKRNQNENRDIKLFWGIISSSLLIMQRQIDVEHKKKY